GRIVDLQLHEKSIQLRFGQGVRAFHLERILRRQHEEGGVELVRRLAYSHAALFHRFKEGRLGLWCRPIDLVRQQNIRKDRPGLKFEKLLAHCIFLNDIGAGDIGGHEIGGELNSRKLQTHYIAERGYEFGFAQTWHAFKKDVPTGEQAHDHAIDDVAVTDDYL